MENIINKKFKNFDEVVIFIKEQNVVQFTCYGKLITFLKDNIKYDYLLEKNTDNTISVIKIKMEVM